MVSDNYYNDINGYNSEVEYDNKFSLYEFCLDAISNKEAKTKGYLVITNKQILIGYNISRGMCNHIATFSRIMQDLSGGGIILKQSETMNLYEKLRRKYIIARVNFDDINSDFSSHVHQYKGSIEFSFIRGKKFTREQYNLMEVFYEEYNDIVKFVCSKFVFNIIYGYYNDKGNIVHNVSESLDNVLNYVYNNIDENLKIDDEVILKDNAKVRKRINE